MTRRTICMSIRVVFLLAALMPATGALVAAAEKPYRVLVVIGDQWDDPESYCIGGPCVPGKDFRDVATMLEIWGIPFDILRLDQQRLQINRFLNGIAEPNYGCVIWIHCPDPGGTRRWMESEPEAPDTMRPMTLFAMRRFRPMTCCSSTRPDTTPLRGNSA